MVNSNEKKRQKVGILTLYFNYNYGAALQAYALRQTVAEMGFDAEDIRYYRVINGKSTMRKDRIAINIKSVLLHPARTRDRLKQKFKKLEKRFYQVFFQLTEKISARKKLFDDFYSTHLVQSGNSYDGHRDISACAREYDVFICGSDNIWNINMLDTSFMLDFVPDDKLKIAYAPGLSSDSLPSHIADRIAGPLKRLDYVSCRESNGAQLVSAMIGREVFIALDPTLLRTAGQWRCLERPVQEVQGLMNNYILCFFLGTNEHSRKTAEAIAELYHMKIVTLPLLTDDIRIGDLEFGDIKLFEAGPKELLYLIGNAGFICTDSYHGTVFSILYNKPFLTFDRFKNKNTKALNLRSYNLLSLLDINTNRIIHKQMCPSELKSILEDEINYDSVNAVIAEKRNESLIYLKNSLNDTEKRKNQLVTT